MSSDDAQFEMKRTQRVSFTEEEVEVLNQAIDVIERHGGSTTPNKFLKKEAITRAEETLEEKEND
ncbi:MULTISPECIES: hypothetical protein [Acinetobacter]|uniref:hypothetical protein n=1 Tax=Acinetobacter TaxID=469 RepID=UPI0015D10717|nr:MULTISPECIES: hypothetical protein [Acinetobacter]MCO8055340.1 hypothetical protein [Acinetobacter towneri]